MTIHCLIADDEPLALDLLESYVTKTPFLKLVGKCSSAFEAMEVVNNTDVDLMFLDIQMPELSGLELSKTLQNGPRVIFTTAFEQYALEGYKVDAMDYLLKPISYQEFLNAANKAKKWFEMIRKPAALEGSPDTIIVKSDYKLIQIAVKDILFIEGLKDYVKIYLSEDAKPIFSLMSMKSMEEKLPESDFMRIHRSFIVNLHKIRTIERNRIIFGKHYLPVSDKYKEKFQEFITKRFFE